MNPKKEAQTTHKIAVLCYLLSETLQEYGAETQESKDIVTDCNNLNTKLENVLDDLFQVKQIKGSTYLIDLCNKVDTVIRKNYQQITE
jgi:hypothetical protein